ncbi:MAG: peptidylprolyl isomerase [Limimaricola sp.]|uniref:peptidyl-prolyl cis-trans isomerase n=1 Tax=Limimaricola sp. TaxID=2211665 RepID=UPI001D3F3405|nr:peptidyl-prolyl cis-trans isomerase [Limimaricola sp.]MBI1416722.1 peptidylprolyl isomerase [Limimaricola sp.]
MAAKKGTNVFVWIVLGLMFVGLMGWGSVGIRGTLHTLGTVGQKEISIPDYTNAMNQQLRALSAQVGKTVTFSQAKAIGLDQQVLASLVTKRVLDNAASDIGLSVGDAQVRDQVMSISAFKGLDGKFDRNAYKATLERNGLTEASFEAGLRAEVTRTLVQSAITGGVTEPASYAATVVKYVLEKRAITYAPVGPEMLASPVPAPTEDQIKAYYDAHNDAFTTPETKQITYALLTPEMISSKMQVDDQAVKDLYQSRIADFVKPERRLVERLAFADTAAATAAKAQLDAGTATFEDLVKARGLTLSDVDMGDVAKADLGAAGDAVFAANPGDVVGPFDTDLGPALFRMNAVIAAQTTTFDEAAPDLRNELASDKAKRAIGDEISHINDLLAGGAKLEDLAQQTDMQLGTIDWTDKTTDGIAAYEEFRTAAAAANQGDFPSVTDLSDGGIFALRVDSVTPPTLQPLDKVHDAAAQGARTQATQEAVMKLAGDLATKVAGGADWASLGLTPQSQTDLTRRSFVDGTPSGFVAKVFALDAGSADAIDAGDKAFVVKLDDVAAPDPTDPATVAEAKSIADQAAAGLAQDVFSMTAARLRQGLTINIDQNAVNAVNSRFQ